MNHQCLIRRGPYRWLSGFVTGSFQAAITEEWLEEKLKEPLGMKRPNIDWGAGREGLSWRESFWKPDSSVWKMQRGEGSLQAAAAGNSTAVRPFLPGMEGLPPQESCIAYSVTRVLLSHRKKLFCQEWWVYTKSADEDADSRRYIPRLGCLLILRVAKIKSFFIPYNPFICTKKYIQQNLFKYIHWTKI